MATTSEVGTQILTMAVIAAKVQALREDLKTHKAAMRKYQENINGYKTQVQSALTILRSDMTALQARVRQLERTKADQSTINARETGFGRMGQVEARLRDLERQSWSSSSWR